MATEPDQRVRDIQREYVEFLDDDQDQGVYTMLIKGMVENQERRLIVNINDLRKKNSARAQALLNGAFEEIIAFQRALKDFVGSADSSYARQHEEFFIGLEGSFGSKHVTPRSLASKFLGNMVCVEGIVTKCSLVRPKVVRSVHYCPVTKKTIERRYTDLTSFDPFPSGAVYPTTDEDGNLLETEYGLSCYKDHQLLGIQEMPEKSPAGQLPRSVDIILDNDLVDSCKPGDRVQVVGTYRCLPGKRGGFTSGSFKTVLIANNVSLLSKELTPSIYRDDVAKCKRLRKKGNIFGLLAQSLAPSIHGHEYIKKAILCMLLGGVEKVLPNGTRLRGDINLLLIGDPSVAKSQLLRYVLHTAPRAIPTTGRGSSGVGLTAAVTTDQETGERRLEAGAMVLADRGVVCIDEFDKMSDIDRTAIHEVMEQGRVTIAKAGIHAKLNARCSVLAAANPVYGRYNQYKTPMENIGLQDSLLSRFDLLFIMLDKMDADADRQIADHVVRMHRYRNPGEQDGDALPFGGSANMLATKDPDMEKNNEEEDTPIYEKYDALLHGNARTRKDKIFSMEFIRKYIHIAKCLKPILTREASECIAEEYSRIRSIDTENINIARTQPVTPRALETLIRLATAHAKARLSKTVDLEDAQTAIELVQFAYFKKVIIKPKKRRRAESDDSEAEEDVDENKSKEKSKKKRRKTGEPRKQPGEDGYDPYDFSSDDDNDIMDTAEPEPQPVRGAHKPRTTSSPSKPGPSGVSTVKPVEKLSDERLKLFKQALMKLFTSEHAQSLQLEQIKSNLKNQLPESEKDFTNEEITSALDQMQEDNKVMVADGSVILI
ncbi:DNA replication licensing factor MCM3 [Nymphon striatum]|nr:DNA replication licensing factor MCM3 [Nymphon striatum]